MQDGPRPLVARRGRRARPPSARPRRWTARTCCSSSTRRAPPASPRASCTRPAATSRRSRTRTSTSSTCKPDTDVYWCTADVGWVTGHSYIVYGPLANRATSVLYEGTPDYPRQGPALVDRREVQGHDLLHRADRDPDVHEVGRRVPGRGTTCRRCALIGTVGEPINPEAWVWYYKVIGGERCPVVDTWWQTETGAIMISALPGRDHAEARERDVPAARHRGRHRRRRGQAGRHPRRRLPRARAAVAVDAARHLGRPASATATPTGSRFDGKYFAGDGAKRDDDGYFWLLGRVDDIMLVVRAQHLHHRGRVGARRPPVGRGGRGGRQGRRRRPGRRSPRS